MVNEVKGDSEKRRRRVRRWLMLGGIPGLLVSAFVLPKAIAGGWWHHRGGCHHGVALTQEEVEARVTRGAHRVLGRLDATQEQTKQVEAVLEGVVPDVVGLRGEARALRQRFHAELEKDEVDRTALMAIRDEGIALADEASKRGVQTIYDLANVLSPEQRRRLLEKVQRWHR